MHSVGGSSPYRCHFVDVETSTYNKGHPFDKRNFMVSCSMKVNGNDTTFCYYTDPNFHAYLRDCVEGNEFCGFNCKFDLHWLANYGIFAPAELLIWDCSLAEFVISGQTNRFPSLNSTLESYGEPSKPDLVASFWEKGVSTEDIPLDILEEYNKYDVDSVAQIREFQQQLMTPEQINLVYLMGEDLKTLQHAEFYGIKWDQQKATEKESDLKRVVEELEKSLKTYLPEIPEGIHFNWDSGDQVSALLYGGKIDYDYSISSIKVYQSGPDKGKEYVANKWFVHTQLFERKFTPLKGTEIKKTSENKAEENHFYQTDEPTLMQITSKKKENRLLVPALLKRNATKKLIEMISSINTKKVEMHWDEDYIHGQFNQNVAITGRLSSSGPNLQNTPVEVDELLVSRYL